MPLALLALVASQGTVPRPSAPMPAADALALFKRLCADTAADPAQFTAAIARERQTFRKQRILPGPDRGPNGSYLSDRAEVDFVAADGLSEPLPAALPLRACGVLSHDGGTVDHPAFVAAMTDALDLPSADSTREAMPRGDRAALTEWTVRRAEGRVGYSLVTRSSPDGRTYTALGMRISRSDR